jgi:hypothetical protein
MNLDEWHCKIDRRFAACGSSTADFPPKTVGWVMFTVEKVNRSGCHVGLSEMVVFGDESKQQKIRGRENENDSMRLAVRSGLCGGRTSIC